MNRQCDKMSRLEFVAIQFGVQLTSIYDLWKHVDKVCQRYLPFPLISKTLLFTKLFHDFILFYFILFYSTFKVILYHSLYGFATLRSHVSLGEILLLSYWLSISMVDGVADRHIFTHLKSSSI